MPQRNPELDNYAFMPTSNDSIPSPINDNPPSPKTCDQCSKPIDPRTNGHSGRSSFTSTTFPALSRGTLSPPTLERQQIGSASTVRSASAPSNRVTSDDSFWYTLYQKEKQSHHEAACAWHEERKRMVLEREELLRQLTALKTSSRFASTASPSRVENDKVFYDPSVVEQANERLRSLSVVEERSGKSSRESSQTRESGGAMQTSMSNYLAGWSGNAGLPSISEERGSISELPLRSVRLGPSSDQSVTIGIQPSSPGRSYPEEGPRSPPTTGIAGVESPLPSNFVKDAGHTPMVAIARSGRQSFADDSGQRPLSGFLTVGLDGASGNIGAQRARIDPDPELHSPKMLPPTPDQGVTILDALTDRLKDVSEHPEDNEPEAVKYAAMLEEVEKEQETISKPDSHQTSSIRGMGGSTQGTDEDLGGIRLKMKRSINFGSEFGRLH